MSARRFKRYPTYKNSGVEWLGEIPEHWKVDPLFTLARERDVKNVAVRDTNVLSLSYGRIIRRDVSDNVGLMPESFETYQIVESGNIVLRLTDLQNDKRSLRVGFVNERGIITSAYVALDFRDKLVPEYAASLLHAYDVTKVFYSLGGGVRQTMKFEDLKWMPLLVPSEREQCAIAAFLDQEMARIDALVVKKERTIALLQEQRTALITRAVTKGLDSNVPMKDSGVEWLGQLPAHWEVRRLKFLLAAPLKYGANEAAELDDPDLPRYVRITDINESDGLRDDTFKSLPVDVAKEYLLREGDLLFARSGATAGKTFLYRRSWGTCAYAGYLIRARLDLSMAIPNFIRHFTGSSGYWQWLSAAFIQATIQNVSAEKYANLLIPLPSIPEQRAIAAFLDREAIRIDALVAKIRDAIERLKEFRTALISAAVTGKIDVREEVA